MSVPCLGMIPGSVRPCHAQGRGWLLLALVVALALLAPLQARLAHAADQSSMWCTGVDSGIFRSHLISEP